MFVPTIILQAKFKSFTNLILKELDEIKRLLVALETF